MNLAKVKVNNALRQSLDIKGKPVGDTFNALNNNFLANTLVAEGTDDVKIYSDEFENYKSPSKNPLLA